MHLYMVCLFGIIQFYLFGIIQIAAAAGRRTAAVAAGDVAAGIFTCSSFTRQVPTILYNGSLCMFQYRCKVMLAIGA